MKTLTDLCHNDSVPGPDEKALECGGRAQRPLAPYADCVAFPRFCRGATTEGSRGLQPTAKDESGRRRGATLEVSRSSANQASLRDAGFRPKQPWAKAHGYRPAVAPRPGSDGIRVSSRQGHIFPWARRHRNAAWPYASRRSPKFLFICGCLLISVLKPGLSAADGLAIGLLLPPEEAEAPSLRDGLSLAIDQANAKSTNPIRLIIRGRAGQWGADAVEAARMVTDEEVSALVASPDGAASHLALQVSGRTATPVVSLCGDSSVTRTGVPWMIRIAPRTTEEAALLFTSITATVSTHPTHWVAIVPDGRAGREITKDLQAAAVNSQCQLDPIIQIKSSTPNLDHLKARIRQTHPDGIALWVDPTPAGQIAEGLRASGYSGILAGPYRLRCADFINAAGKSLEGFLSTEIVRDGSSQSIYDAFTLAFRKQFAREADPTAAFSYDAGQVLIALVQNHDPGSLHRAFPLRDPLPGATGILTFDPQGNRKLTLRLVAYHAGHFRPQPQPDGP